MMRKKRLSFRFGGWRFSLLWVSAVLVFFAGPLCAAEGEEDDGGVMIGYGEVGITPSLGVTMPGYFRVRKASGVLDPLLAKVLVLSKGDATVAIVALDLIGVNGAVVADIRTVAADPTGVGWYACFTQGHIIDLQIEQPTVGHSSHDLLLDYQMRFSDILNKAGLRVVTGPFDNGFQ